MWYTLNLPHSATMQQLKDKYPEMPGIGFYGSTPGNYSQRLKRQMPGNLHDTATFALIEYANKVSVELWPDKPK